MYDDGIIKTPMLLWIINDCKKALEQNAYIAALSMALLIPDICGSIETPGKHVSRARFSKWFDDNIGKYGDDDTIVEVEGPLCYPFISGNDAYDLRCALFHEGIPNIKKPELEITLVIDDNPYCETNGEMYGTLFGRNKKGELIAVRKRMRFNVRPFCIRICSAAEEYYLKHKNEFDAKQSEAIDFGRLGNPAK